VAEPPAAVLLMAYGSPGTLDEVEPYFADVRGGRPASPEAVAELRGRYAAIGGSTPLLPITRDLAAKVQADLGAGYRVHVGMRHWHPYIREAVADIRAEGAGRIVALALAPHYSRLSVGAYAEALSQALAAGQQPAPPVHLIERWHDHPGFRRLIADRIADALSAFPPGDGPVHVVFSAHSLPERILSWHDPYPDELRESAGSIARLAGLPAGGWEMGFQSAGGTREPWLGPDLVDVIARLAAEGRRRVLSVPFGFVCEHLEVLYDIDIEAQAAARGHGVTLRRIAMPNADPAFARVLADLVRAAR
jgi:ferrochelatase